MVKCTVKAFMQKTTVYFWYEPSRNNLHKEALLEYHSEWIVDKYLG